MTVSPKTFQFRPATLANEDDLWFVEAWASTIPYLNSIGSHKQWRTNPTSELALEKARGIIADSDLSAQKYPPEYPEKWEEGKPPPKDWSKSLIASVVLKKDEIPDALKERYASAEGDTIPIPVAFMSLHAVSPDYTRPIIPEQDEKEPLMYLTFLMTDHRAREYAKGSGPVMLEIAKQEMKKFGIRRLCADCWNGNERRLVGYYEGNGFVALGDIVMSFDDGREDWPGAVIQMRV